MFTEPETDEPDGKSLTSQIIVGVACAIMLPVFLLFRNFGRTDLALPACLYLGMIWLAVALHWELRKRYWFWAVIGLVLVLHLFLLTRFTWPAFTVNRITLLPIGVADFLVVIGIIRLTQKLIPKPSA